MVRAIVIREFGDPSGMAVVDFPEPVPGAGQVVIATEAIGVGGVDAVIRRGTLGTRFAQGMIAGSEVAGIITAVGDDVDRAWIGRRIWAFTGTNGGYVESALAHVVDVTALPEGLTAISAVALGSAATVAHFALVHAHFVAGESVLVRGAGGSIGIATVELAARGGAAVVAVTTSSADRGQQLEKLGATHVLDRAGNGGWDAPELFDVIIDIVAGEAVPAFIDRLAPNGRMILVGAVGGFPPADFGMRLMQTFQQSRSVATFSLATIPPATRSAVRTELFEAAVRGELHAIVHQVMPLDQASQAHDHMDRRSVFGRIVLTP